MGVVWRQQVPITVRDVTESLEKKRTIAYTTVMTIMGRLVKKGLLTRKLQGIGYLYKTRVTRDKFIANAVHGIFTSTLSALGSASAAYFIKEIQKLKKTPRIN